MRYRCTTCGLEFDALNEDEFQAFGTSHTFHAGHEEFELLGDAV